MDFPVAEAGEADLGVGELFFGKEKFSKRN